MTSAREEVLARIRGALGESPKAVEVPRAYRRSGDHAAGDDALVEQLVDRLVDYRAEVARCGSDDAAIGEAVGRALSARGIGRVLCAPGVPAAWRTGVPDSSDDDAWFGPRELDTVPAVLTGSAVTVSETGTIVLDGSPECGRRALTLVPDVHVCVVRVPDVVQTVPEGLRRLDPTRVLTFISGPSATSDIELSRVEGVHGPRTLIVVLAG